MKKTMAVLMVTALFVVAAPVMAMDHGAMQTQQDVESARECDLLLKNCAQEVDSIQQRIERIKKEINEKGASAHTRDELRILNQMLKDANDNMRALTKPGR